MTASPGPTRPRRAALDWVCILFLLLGAIIRADHVPIPLDGRTVDAWRELDIAGIARNFSREGMDILAPRIDWRRDGPGFVESEFPLLPWLMAVGYRAVGVHPVLGRVLSFGVSLAALAAFLALARLLLPPVAATVATGVVVLSPLLVRVGASLQHDGWMFLGYVVGPYAFLRWLRREESGWLWATLIATAMAILLKPAAALLGFVYLALLLERRGIAGLRRPVIWGLAVAVLLPGVLWFAHAKHLWQTYGNSLGISNEYHWAGWDLFTNPKFVLRIVGWDILIVWGPTGVVIAALAFLAEGYRNVVRLCLIWLAAVTAFYLAAARTTGDTWALYYHIVSIPPAALLIGLGAQALLQDRGRRRAWFVAGGFALVGGAMALTGARGAVGADSAWFVRFAWWAFGGALVLALGARVIPARWRPLATVTAALLPLAVYHGHRVRDYGTPRSNPAFANAPRFAAVVPPESLIAVAGDACRDEDGYAVAYEAPFYFYWMDRKGFSVCLEDQSVPTLRALAQRGARYYVATAGSLLAYPDLEGELRQAFPLVGAAGADLLFYLPSAAPPNVAGG